jgi:vacuolar-type H+-ATPase subunit I/STV1
MFTIHDAPGATPTERAEVRTHLETRRAFASHVVTFLVVNGFLVLLWAVMTAGYFWPGWVMGGWAAVLLLHAWDSFVRRVTEGDIDAELRRDHR